MSEKNESGQKNESVLRENSRFYERQYSRKNTVLHYLHMLVSFDQQSKARLNKKFLLQYLENHDLDDTQRPIELLDFGSGWGTFLHKMPRSFKLYCFDLSKNAMEQVCRTLRYLFFDVSEAVVRGGEIIEPQKLDIIVCSHVLEHVASDSDLLDTFYDALVVDGILLINVPINEVWNDPKHLREYTPASIRNRLETSGFSIIIEKEEDKWTGVLLEKEKREDAITLLKKIVIRCIRLVLAITPLTIVNWSERAFLASRPNQQLVVIARKKNL